MPSPTRTRLTTAALVAGAATLAGVATLAAPASAHNYLVSSTPEADSVLTELPERFDITTNDLLLDLGDGSDAFVLRVSDADGLFYGDGCVDVDGPTMSTPAALGPAGDYTVDWQIVSIDGHPVADSFEFEWDPSDPSVATEGSAEPPVCGAAAPEPSASASPDDSDSPDGATDEAADQPGDDTADPSAEPTEPTTATDSLSTVLWVGGIALVIAALVTLGVKFARAKRTGSRRDDTD
ncbi:copper resistance protein CopC [Marisediminicola sp. LYQ134]|uniref:copper resistance CopC family protein n=1 Tax=unclassified Marisediminicola TaxID=2618316 RepID=UPI0039837320